MSQMASHMEVIVTTMLQQIAKEQSEGGAGNPGVAQLPEVQLQVFLASLFLSRYPYY